MRFQQFCEICGIDSKDEKTEIGQNASFLGLLGNFTTKENGFQMSIRLTEGKSSLWAALIQAILGKENISHQVLEGLIGKLSFS